MPSAPRPVSTHVLVRHPKFGEKWVRRDQLASLSARWVRVGSKPRPAVKSAESTTSTTSSTTETGTTSPDKSKED